MGSIRVSSYHKRCFTRVGKGSFPGLHTRRFVRVTCGCINTWQAWEFGIYVLLRPLQTSLFARDIDDSRASSVYATSSGHREGPFPVSPVLRVAQETPESPHQEA